MQRTNLFVLVLFWLPWIGFTQGTTVLDPVSNSLADGDSSQTQAIDWMDPGPGGENLIWDFSGLKRTGQTAFYGVRMDRAATPNDTLLPLIFSENGYDYRYLTGEDVVVEMGFENPAKKMSMVLHDPIVRMKFPLAYGQHFIDSFDGVAWFDGAGRIDLSGTYEVAADANGVLVFPDRILHDVLRIRTVKRALHQGVCGSSQSVVVKYYWYAQGYRYPVLMISAVENRSGSREPVVIRSGWMNLSQPRASAGDATHNGSVTGSTAVHAVVVYPNPFAGRLSWSCYLRNPVVAGVDLLDLSGRVRIVADPPALRPAGLLSGSLPGDAAALPPGIYLIRFTIGNEVIIRKVVRI